MNVTFEVTHPAIKYSEAGQWTKIRNIAATGHTFVKLCRKAGGTASLTFMGTQVFVFGNQGANKMGDTGRTVSTYSLEGGVGFSSFTDHATDIDLFNQLFYTSPLVPDGEHTLVIENLNEDAWFWLGFIRATTSSPSGLPPESSPNTTPTVASSQSTSTELKGNKTGIATPTITVTSPSEKGKGNRIGLIVGPTVAVCVVTLLALIGWFFFWKRKHLRSISTGRTNRAETPHRTIQPFPIHQMMGQTAGSTVTSQLSKSDREILDLESVDNLNSTERSEAGTGSRTSPTRGDLSNALNESPPAYCAL